MFSKDKPIFDKRGKERISLHLHKILDIDIDDYKIAGIGYTVKDGEIEAGYEIYLSGKIKELYRNDELVAGIHQTVD